jgi:hypothetical protein
MNRNEAKHTAKATQLSGGSLFGYGNSACEIATRLEMFVMIAMQRNMIVHNRSSLI